MKFQRGLKEEVSVNLTPLIDVVFLLLIFFMVTTTFSRDTRLLLNLAEANGELAQPIPNQIEILVTQNGSYAINGRALVNTQIETLMRGIDEISGGDSTVPIVITADANSTHQAVITAMDAVGQLGYTQLSIATRQPETEQ